MNFRLISSDLFLIEPKCLKTYVCTSLPHLLFLEYKTSTENRLKSTRASLKVMEWLVWKDSHPYNFINCNWGIPNERLIHCNIFFWSPFFSVSVFFLIAITIYQLASTKTALVMLLPNVDYGGQVNSSQHSSQFFTYRVSDFCHNQC